MDFSQIPNGCLPTGTETPFGTIERASYTAYYIGGQWVPFAKIHGEPKPAEQLASPWVARY